MHSMIILNNHKLNQITNNQNAYIYKKQFLNITAILASYFNLINI